MANDGGLAVPNRIAFSKKENFKDTAHFIELIIVKTVEDQEVK